MPHLHLPPPTRARNCFVLVRGTSIKIVPGTCFTLTFNTTVVGNLPSMPRSIAGDALSLSLVPDGPLPSHGCASFDAIDWIDWSSAPAPECATLQQEIHIPV
jgi:hypothetical protein